ncbi:MAG: asparagine--tRNA ligase, partial [Planctomycetes bacterium]|nr:asparagine--tRNA ligase [Planctomycetota bacterium]
KDVPNIEKLLDVRHLWMRSPKPRAILKIRSEVIQAIRQFYYERDYVCFDSPIFTPNACEGTSTLFETEYFGNPMYLSQSGQLYGEAGALAFGKVVVFGPTFRAEKSKTRRHLTEFWMIEPEVAWLELDGIMDLAEEKLEYIAQWCLKRCRPELEILERDLSKLESVKRPFPRISYSEVQKVLAQKKDEFAKSSDPELKKLSGDILKNGPGDDLGAADETAISMQYDRPVMIHRYPSEVKAFYMKRDPKDPRFALCVDVIAPEGVGEIIGGAQREDSHDALVERIKEHKLPMEAFQWYLDLRKYGTVPHGGFGLGLERTVQWISGTHHVRETIPFPRTIVRMSP